MRTITRTERGWPGHYICASECLFRRNTILECEETRIVVSTVGLYRTANGGRIEFREIGIDRYFETMAFYAQRENERYWDADVSRAVEFESGWKIAELDAEDRANDMHEAVVSEISERLATGDPTL